MTISASTPRARTNLRSLILPLLAFVAYGFLAHHGYTAEPASQESAPSNPPIHTFNDFWTDARRKEVRPIHLEMVVTYYDPSWGNLWATINGVPGYFSVHKHLDIRSHEKIRVDGHVIPAEGLDPNRATFTILQKNVPIKPINADGRLADSDALKSKVVAFNAIVNSERLAPGNHYQMDLVAGGHQTELYCWEKDPSLLGFPAGSVVRVTGVYNARTDPLTNAVDVDVWVARKSDIIKTGDLKTDPEFKFPLSTIGKLQGIYLNGEHRAHVVGVVRDYTPGKGIVLRDQTGQVFVRTFQTPSLQMGDVVEAVGDPFTGDADWVLNNSIVRRASKKLAEKVKEAEKSEKKLHLAGQILALTPSEAAEGRAVDITGVVTWANPATKFIYLRDPSGGVLVHSAKLNDERIKSGAGIEIIGKTTPGSFAPEVVASTFNFWGGGLLPSPKTVTLEQEMAAPDQGRRIKIQGQVIDLKQQKHLTRLRLSTATGSFIAWVNADDGRLTGVKNAMISVSGVCQAIANSRRQLTGIEVWVRTRGDVHVEQSAPSDPFAVPLKKIGALRQFNASDSLNFWARVHATVTYQLPGRFLFAQNGTDGILILSKQRGRLAPGDVVEAAGLPGIESNRVVLRDAVFRRVGHQKQPAAFPIVNPRTISESLNNRLVKIQGRLENVISERTGRQLAVESNGAFFNAILREGAGADETALPEPGSKVELTGVYQVIHDERHQPTAFRLELRSPADIRVLRRPSWWTPKRALTTTGLLGFCIFIAMAWLQSLRRRVRKQTKQIREQVAKEANLEAHNREIVENASDFIFTAARTGELQSFNTAGERMTGYSRSQALTMNIRDLIIPEDDESGFPVFSPDQDGRQTATFQGKLKRRDGKTVWVEASVRLMNGSENSSGLLGVVRDISERKEVEEELKRARDAAEENTKAKSAFLANMSHEIRTPMNGVIGMSNLLLDTRLESEQRDYAETIRNSAEALMTVLNDILDFSKIEAGKLHLESLKFDLNNMVEETLELMAARAVSKQLELAGFVDHQIPRTLRGDPGRIRQVLLNLIGNALKFTETGEVVVNVTPKELSEQSARVRFEVTDTGIGLTEEAQGRLFHAFEQADASTTRKFGGTGLGLAISKQIVELMGGEIGVCSTVGNGSTFWFELPLAVEDSEDSHHPLPEIESLSQLKVLIVDDNATNQKVVAHFVRNWSMEPETTDQASDAISKLVRATQANAPFNLVLLDFHMPVMNGDELAAAIQANPSITDVPMILLTSLDRRFSREELETVGIAASLTKPIRQRELLEAILGAVSPEDLRRLQQRRDGASNTSDPAADEIVPLRILVAEDNQVNQRLIALQLKKLGYSTDIVANGHEVLEAATRKTYDVVLMDCQMPEMDGYEATARLRESRENNGLYVIAMTANAMEGDREKCFEAGMDDYLPKPTRIDELRAALQRCGRERMPKLETPDNV